MGKIFFLQIRVGGPGPWACARPQQNFFVSLPLKDNHSTSPSPSIEPLSLILFQWILPAAQWRRRHYYSCFADEQLRRKQASVIIHLVTAKLGQKTIFLRPDPEFSTIYHTASQQSYLRYYKYFWTLLWVTVMILHTGVLLSIIHTRTS